MSPLLQWIAEGFADEVMGLVWHALLVRLLERLRQAGPPSLRRGTLARPSDPRR